MLDHLKLLLEHRRLSRETVDLVVDLLELTTDLRVTLEKHLLCGIVRCRCRRNWNLNWMRRKETCSAEEMGLEGNELLGREAR